MEWNISSRSSMPAFKAQKSRRPKWEKQVAKAEDWAPQDDTSVMWKWWVEGGKSASSEAGGGLMSAMKTCQDWERRCFVNARPMPGVKTCQLFACGVRVLELLPEEPPVMRATGAAGAMIDVRFGGGQKMKLN